MEDFLQVLNDEQRKAVMHTQGPSLVIAGAGSGKTRVLTTRIAYLISQGVDPFNILALTFTNKASREMRDRIQSMIGSEAKNIWMGTFHSVFAKILRVEAAKLGYPNNFTIYDTDDSKNLVKTIIKEENLDKKMYKPSYVYHRISSAKNSFMSPRKYLENEEIMSEDYANGRPKLGELYLKYVQRCYKAGAMDFDDLLLKTHELLEKFPDALNKYQHFFKHVLIDEFQDTNLVQYYIVKRISASHRNLTVVGDDAQSIYSFRGANIQNILHFERDYPELKVFKLEQNYRSTQNIVKASDNIIKNNRHQLPKNLWTSNPEGNKIKLLKADTENEEGQLVAQSIVAEKARYNLNNSDVAILYRTNAQSRAFEEALRRMGVAYRIYGGLSFYQRKEIKDILAYFRFVLNPADEEALRRIINYPARGIGDTSLAKIRVFAQESDASMWEVIQNIKQFAISSRIVNAVSDFAALIKSFQIDVQKYDAFEAASLIAKGSGIAKLLFEDRSIEGISRHENLQNLLSAIKEFTEREDLEDKSLGMFLQDVALLTDADQDTDDEDKVTLMTVHAAKGLEFSLVFVVGLEEELFPSQMSSNTRDDLEEERRLFYVAVTRAEKLLYLSYASSRFRWGQLIFSEPSRFLDEINPSFIDYGFISKPKPVTRPASNYQVKPKSSFKPINRKIVKKPTPPANPNFVPDDTSSLKEGMIVTHERFGRGNVLDVSGEGSNKKASIKFDVGVKQILLRFAKMKIIKQ